MSANNREGARNIEEDTRNELFISPLLLGPLLRDTPVMHALTAWVLTQSRVCWRKGVVGTDKSRVVTVVA